MKRNVILFALILLIILFIAGCSSEDKPYRWMYPLPNGYDIREEDTDIVLTKYTAPGDTQPTDAANIPSHIKEFACDDRYVFSRNSEDIETNNLLKEQYYILDTLTQVLYGPFDSLAAFQTEIEKMGIPLPVDWYRTANYPFMHTGDAAK